MSNNKAHTYSITLDLQSSAASKQILKEFQNSFTETEGKVDSINDTLRKLAIRSEDLTTIEKQYNKALDAQLQKEKKSLEDLEAKKIALLLNKKLLAEDKSAQQEALRLEEEALRTRIESLEATKKQGHADLQRLNDARKTQARILEEERQKRVKLFQAKEKEAKLLEKMNKIFKSNMNANSKVFQFTNKMVKAQERLNTLLGKESKMRKFLTNMASNGGKVAKGVGKAVGKGAVVGVGAAGMALGVGGAIAGGVMGAAGDLAAKETAIKGLKSGLTRDDVEKVFISTGGDYSTIVTEINKLSRKFKGDELIAATIQAVKNPGFADVLMASTEFKTSTKNLGHVLEQIKRNSGILDLTDAMAASTQSENVSTKKIAQRDYIQAYASLQGAGLDEEKINSIIDDIASKSGYNPDTFVETFNKTDLSKYVEGQQQIQVQGIKLNSIDATNASPKSPAEKLFEAQNRFTLAKDKLMMRILPPLTKILEDLLNNKNIEELITSVVDTLVKILPPAMKTLSAILEVLQPVASSLIQGMVDFFTSAEAPQAQQKAVEQANEDASILQSIGKWFAAWGMRMGNAQFAQGGIATAPSICGEAGPELIIPLDNSRAGRASQIVNNFNTNQNFNMAANQSTPLAFSQAVGQNRFVRRCAT